MRGFLRVLWTLPNQVLGLLGAIGGKLAHKERNPTAFLVVGSWLGRLMSRLKVSSATTIGDFILVGKASSLKNESLIAHERVHILQSNALGWLYLHAMLIGYLIGGFRSGFRHWHDASPFEIDADMRSGYACNIEGNRYARARTIKDS